MPQQSAAPLSSIAWDGRGSGRHCKETERGEPRAPEVRRTAVNKAKEEQNKGCCLLPVGLLFFSEADPTQRNETSPFCDKGMSLDF